VIKDEERTAEPVENQETNGSQEKLSIPLAPYFGRTARVVGDWQSVDAAGTPHEKNKRGELGKPLYNWYLNRTANDPLARTAFPQSAADKRNTLQSVVSSAPKGSINPDKIEATDPQVLSQHIKKVAEYFGAHVVGIAELHPSMVYSGNRHVDDVLVANETDGSNIQDPKDLVAKYPYAICMSTAWDINMIQAHRHHIGDQATVVIQVTQTCSESNNHRVDPCESRLVACFPNVSTQVVGNDSRQLHSVLATQTFCYSAVIFREDQANDGKGVPALFRSTVARVFIRARDDAGLRLGLVQGNDTYQVGPQPLAQFLNG